MREIKVGDEILFNSTFSDKVYRLTIKAIRNGRVNFSYIDISDDSCGTADWSVGAFAEGFRDGTLVLLSKSIPIEDDPEYSDLFI